VIGRDNDDARLGPSSGACDGAAADHYGGERVVDTSVNNAIYARASLSL
jgi:hypothetical protein